MNEETTHEAPDTLEGKALGMNFAEAQTATSHGATAAYVSAAFTFIAVAGAIFAGDSGDIGFMNDPLNFIDVALIAGLGFGMKRHSRAAAVTMFIYFVFSKILIAIDTGAMAGIAASFIFLYFFGLAVRGSFAYHKIRQTEDPEYTPPRKWTYWVGIPAGLLLVTLISLGILSEVGVVPAIGVVDGSELSDTNKSLLIELGVIEPGEEVEMFYSTGLTSISGEGNLLTNKRIISYENMGNGVFIYATTYDQVEEMSILVKGDYLTDTILEIWPANQDGFRLFLSTEEGGDQRFIDAINARLPAEKHLMVDFGIE